MSKGIGIICKARKVLLQSTLVTMYYSFIYPYLIYCIEVWGSACKNILMPLTRLQKRALRVIAGVSPRTHTEPLFNLFRMLPINSIYEYSVCTFMYKYSGTIFPAVINDLFIPTSTIHAHNTRSNQKLFVQGTRTSAAASCIRHTGVKIWNKVSTIILPECSLPTFKYCVRDYLLSFKLDW